MRKKNNILTPEQEIRIVQRQIEEQAQREKREPVILPKQTNFQTNKFSMV